MSFGSGFPPPCDRPVLTCAPPAYFCRDASSSRIDAFDEIADGLPPAVAGDSATARRTLHPRRIAAFRWCSALDVLHRGIAHLERILNTRLIKVVSTDGAVFSKRRNCVSSAIPTSFWTSGVLSWNAACQPRFYGASAFSLISSGFLVGDIVEAND